MTKNEKLFAMFIDGLIEREEVPPSCWRKPRKHRKPKPPSLASAIKKAKAEGMDVTIAPDGSMTFKSVGHDTVMPLQGNGALTVDDELAQWRKKRANQN
jgi:hypothetical protein